VYLPRRRRGPVNRHRPGDARRSFTSGCIEIPRHGRGAFDHRLRADSGGRRNNRRLYLTATDSRGDKDRHWSINRDYDVELSHLGGTRNPRPRGKGVRGRGEKLVRATLDSCRRIPDRIDLFEQEATKCHDHLPELIVGFFIQITDLERPWRFAKQADLQNFELVSSL
jgi:hypothetical protein